MPPWEFRGRWALVTGASAGLGAEFAYQLAARGSNLVLAARRRDRLDRLAHQLAERFGVRAEAMASDLFRDDEPERLWGAATAIAPIDILVNNAGLGAQGRFDATPIEKHLEVIQLNCTALVRMAHLALPSMRERGAGAIINVASIAAYQPVPMLATYAASKAFVLSFSQALWAENHGHGVRVLTLSPGRTPTEFQEIAGTGRVRKGFGVRSAKTVVAATLDGLERDRITVMPGLENRLVAWTVRAMPQRLSVPLIRRLLSRVWKP